MSKGHQVLICKECHYWWPFEIIPAYGKCFNRKSVNFGEVIIYDKEACPDFKERDIRNDVDFYWCRTCKEMVYRSEIDLHAHHEVYIGVTLQDVEDNVEFTFAGD